MKQFYILYTLLCISFTPSLFAGPTNLSGLYTIRNIHSNFCAEVDKALIWGGANVQQWECNTTAAQSWEFTHLGGDVYSIKNAHSNLYLDVAYGGNSSNVQQWGSALTSNSQKWHVRDAENHSFILQPQYDPNKCLDISGASTELGANIQSYACNGTIAQKFEIIETSHTPFNYTGFYEIRNNASNKCVDVTEASTSYGANIQQWDCNTTEAQSWKFIDKGYGDHEVVNTGSNLLMEVSWGGAQENIHQWGRHNGQAQRWKISNGINGTVNFTPKSDASECLDVSGNALYSGANIRSIGCDNSSAQQFMLIPKNYAQAPVAIEAEDYTTAYGIIVESSIDIGGTLQVGWIDSGDWLSYENIPLKAGNWSLHIRSGSPIDNNKVRLVIDGDDKGLITIENTHSYFNYATVRSHVFPISTDGNHTIRLESLTGGYTLNWIKLVPHK